MMIRIALPLLLVMLGVDAQAQCASATQRLIADRQYDEAKAQLTASLSRSPGDHAAVECLGRVAMAVDRPREASGHFEKAVKLDDKVSSHHLWLANALGSLADSTSKIKLPFLARRIKGEFDRAVALDPASIDGRHGLIQFYSQAPGVMGGGMEKAWEQVREIAKLNAMRGHFEAASLYAREKRIAESEREFVTAFTTSPDSSIAGLTLGSYYQNNQRWAEAFGVYDRMIVKFPNEPAVLFGVGRTAAVSGQQLDRGEKALKSWMANPPKDASSPTRAAVHSRLGTIYEKQGRKELARQEYQQALSIDPTNDNAKKSLAALK